MFSVLQTISVRRMMQYSDTSGRKVTLQSMKYPTICLEGLGKSTGKKGSVGKSECALRLKPRTLEESHRVRPTPACERLCDVIEWIKSELAINT
jgi:hypothetical protein